MFISVKLVGIEKITLLFFYKNLLRKAVFPKVHIYKNILSLINFCINKSLMRLNKNLVDYNIFINNKLKMTDLIILL